MMRAKIRINSVQHSETQDVISGAPVTSSPYDADGNSEDNTFARYTPSGALTLTINNPAFVGKIHEGDTFYVDFTKVE